MEDKQAAAEVSQQFENIDFNSSPDDNNKESSNNEDQEQNEASNSTMEDISTDEHSDYFIEITVADPQRVGEGIHSHLSYKVTTHTSIPKFKGKQFSVMRRFSDFLGLHEVLVNKYLRLGRIIPPAPEKNYLGSTKVKMSAPSPTDSGSTPSQEWIEHRRAALERFMLRIAHHPILCLDPDFINFLQTNEELPRAVNTAALSGAGVLRLFNRFGETVNKITYKMDENDPWFQDKNNEVDNLEGNLLKLHYALKSLVQHRKELSTLTGAVARSAALLSTCEEHTGLSRALSQLADTEEKVELLRSEQANSDLFLLTEIIKDYLGLIGAIKDAFHERVKVFQNWEHSQIQLTKRRENKAKLELANRTEKIEAAQREITDWESKVQRCQQEFEDISKEIKREMERFDVKRVSEFRSIIVKYLEDSMAHQQQLVKYWDLFIPIAKEIS